MPLIPSDHREQYRQEDLEYYLATKINSRHFRFRFLEGSLRWNASREANAKSFSSYKTYPGRRTIRLKPDLKIFRKLNWEKTVLKRHSSRNFVSRSIRFTELSNLLIMACGLKRDGAWLQKPTSAQDWPRRALPSGGALQPLEIYVLAQHVKGLPRGLYHLNLLSGGLTCLRADKRLFQLDDVWMQKNLFGDPAALIFVSAVFSRSQVKYGPRALRFILLEAGGMGAQMNLLANAMNLDFCFDGGGFEDKIEELIGIDGQQEGLLTTFVLGHAAHD
jgi:SagB-type dehydrogenase family enzyme